MIAVQLDTWLAFLAEHRTVVLMVGGLAVAVLLVLARVCRNQKGRSAALTVAASTVALAFSAEGMWEVATKALHLSPRMAVLLFAFAEILMLSEANQARKKIAEKRDPRRHLRAVWVIALVAGLAAASHADNLSGQVIRATMPMAVAWQWSSRIKDEQPDAIRDESSWIWTPRTIGVHLGLIKPGKQDLKKVDRDRRIDAITTTAHRLHHGSERLKGWRKARLRRLALEADDAMVVEAQRRVARVNRIVELTSPDARTGEPSDAERDLMDELRRLTTNAEAKIRVDHARAFGVGGEPLVELDGIRMPAHLAAQIGDMPEGWTPGFREPVRESGREPVRESGREPVRESGSGSPRAAAATHAPAQQRITEPVSATQRADDKKIAAAHARLTKRLKREPSGQELGDAAGVSKATANRWKRENLTTKES